MKNKLILLGLLLTLVMPAFAQRDTIRSNKNEFSIGYGHFPASSFLRWRGVGYNYDIDPVGSFYTTYTRRLTKVIGIGATYCFDPRQLTYYDRDLIICRLGESSHTLMGHLKVNWLNTRHVVLYTKLAIGASFWGYWLKTFDHPSESSDILSYQYEIILPDNHYCFAYQFTPIGIEIGNKRWAGFVQFGLGMEGCFSIGVRYGLKDKKQ